MSYKVYGDGIECVKAITHIGQMPRIKELPHEERPRERLWQQGGSALRVSELIAILLRTGMRGKSAITLSEELLQQYPSLNDLCRAPVQALAKTKGLGPAKAIQLKAAFELGARLAKSRIDPRPIECAEDVLQLLGEELRQLPCETMRILSLNTKSRLVAQDEISSGSLNETVSHPREIFKTVILRHAASFILVHNHPSGDPSPSQADLQFTRQIREAAMFMQLNFHDHVILGLASSTHPAYFSFRENGYL